MQDARYRELTDEFGAALERLAACIEPASTPEQAGHRALPAQ
jgi:hypothetical protein